MNISKATREFRIRRYLWAKMKMADEIREGFPHFRAFKGGMTWKECAFMTRLSTRDQGIFVGGQLKQYYRDAAAALGESISVEERALLDRSRAFIQVPSPLQKELAARRRLGESVKFASKRKLLKATTAAFTKAFDDRGLEVLNLQGYPSPFFNMRCSGWIVQTSFEFGRSQSLIAYNHLIASEDRISHPTTPGVTAPALVLDFMLCWIGFCHMQWEYLTDADVEPACDSVVTLCREFFDELPALLHGLERDKVEE